MTKRHNRSVFREVEDIRAEERVIGFTDGINACLAVLVAHGDIPAAQRLRAHFADEADRDQQGKSA